MQAFSKQYIFSQNVQKYVAKGRLIHSPSSVISVEIGWLRLQQYLIKYMEIYHETEDKIASYDILMSTPQSS